MLDLHARSQRYQHCFISLKPLGDQNELGTLVWHDGLNDAVWVLKKYAPADSMDVVRAKEARKAFVASLSFPGGLGLEPEELKAFLERTYRTKIDV